MQENELRRVSGGENSTETFEPGAWYMYTFERCAQRTQPGYDQREYYYCRSAAEGDTFLMDRYFVAECSGIFTVNGSYSATVRAADRWLYLLCCKPSCL